MKEIIGVVVNGRVKLPPMVQLPDGLRVRVIWDETNDIAQPYEREELTEEDLRDELLWATGSRFSQ